MKSMIFFRKLLKIIKVLKNLTVRSGVDLWVRDMGDKIHRLNYELNENSLVFDVGGYEGQWTSDIFSKYCCKIHVFEPVVQFAQKIKNRFSQNNRIFVWDFGLSNKTYYTDILVNKNSSSVFKKGDNTQRIKLVKAIDFMYDHNINKIALMKINIEGAEYDLLEHLIKAGFIKNIKNIQVQFHEFMPHAKARMNSVQKKLAQTHYLTYQYPFIWENWRIKE